MSPSTSLLERAKQHASGRRTRVVSDEEIALALAWVRGEITVTQAAVAMHPKEAPSGKVLYRFAVILREAHRRGILKIGKVAA